MVEENYREIKVNYSITNAETDDAKDTVSPFSFLDFIQYTKVDYTPEEYSSFYTAYLKKYYSLKGGSKTEQNNLFKDYYREFIEEIVISYTTENEKRFLQKIDFTDPADLDIAIPFFANKLKEVALFYKKRRDEGKYVIERNKLKGSTTGVEKAIFDNIYNYILTAEDTLNSKTFDIDSVTAKLGINIEEYIDVYGSYFDLPRTPTGEDITRTELYSSNLNDIDAKYYLDPLGIEALTTTNFLSGLEAFKINPPTITAETFDAICDPDNPLAELFNNETKGNLTISDVYRLKRQLLSKYIGTDIYFLDTSVTPAVSGLLIQSENPTNNLLNLQTADTATVVSNDAKLLRDVGLFFEPDDIGLFKLNADNYSYTLDRENLESDFFYVFPDPNLYGNVSTNPQSAYPVQFKIDNRRNSRNVSSGLASGDPLIDNKASTFESYTTKERSTSELQKLNTISEKINFSDLYNEGAISKYQFDSYGNEYALFKSSQPKARIEPANTSILNLLLNGHTFYDIYEGYNFDYSTTSKNGTTIRSGLTANTNGYSGLINFYTLYFREFFPYQELAESVRNILPVYRDGGAFTFLDGAPLPAPFDGWDPRFPGPRNYYYSVYADATFPVDISVTTDQTPLSTITSELEQAIITGEVEFNFLTDVKNYLSATDLTYRYYDCGYFADDLALDNDFNYEKEYRYIDSVDPRAVTTLAISSTGNLLTKEERRSLEGALYVKNQSFSTSSPLQSALELTFSKYSDSVQYDIFNHATDFDIIGDNIFIETPNNLVIDVINYDGSKFIISNNNNTLFSINSANKLEAFSNRLFVEKSNKAYFTKFTAVTGNNAKNYWSVIPSIYEYNLSNNTNEKVFPDSITEDIITTFQVSVSGAENNNFTPEEIITPYLTFNSVNNLFKLTYIVSDINELAHFFDIEFTIENNKLVISNVSRYDTNNSLIRSSTFGSKSLFAEISANSGSFNTNNFILSA